MDRSLVSLVSLPHPLGVLAGRFIVSYCFNWSLHSRQSDQSDQSDQSARLMLFAGHLPHLPLDLRLFDSCDGCCPHISIRGAIAAIA